MSLPCRPKDFNTLRKHLQTEQPLLNISKRLLEELLSALPGFQPTLSEFCQSHTMISVPRTFLWKCFELLDLRYNSNILLQETETKLVEVEDLAPALRYGNA